MPNVEYFAPWFNSEAVMRSMSYERWQTLSPHARRICGHVVCDCDEPVIGDGSSHPRAAVREAHRVAQLEQLGEPAAAEYLARC